MADNNSVKVTADSTTAEVPTIHYVYSDGSPVPASYCVNPDHYVTTLQITLRTMRPVSPSVVQNLLQGKFEIVGIVPGETVCVVRNKKHGE